MAKPTPEDQCMSIRPGVEKFPVVFIRAGLFGLGSRMTVGVLVCCMVGCMQLNCMNRVIGSNTRAKDHFTASIGQVR